jgi:hypothetical protein
MASLQALTPALLQGLHCGLVGSVPQLLPFWAWPTNPFIWHPVRVEKFAQFMSATALFWL